MEKGNRERSPLQDLNGLFWMNKSDSKKSLNPSSSRNRRPHFFSSNAPNGSAVASKAALPRNLFLQKSKKNQPPLLAEWQSGKRCAKPVSKSGQRSTPSAFEVNSVLNLKKKSKEFQTKTKKSQELATSSCDHLEAPTVKTPPVEASISPDIQFPSDYKMIVSQSTEPPVCYAAGHLLSGVADKRKCRCRGSLRGCEKVNLFHGELDEINDSQDSSIPLLAEGSVRWHEDQGNDSRNRLDKCRVINDNASAAPDLSSSPSTLCGDASDSVWDDIVSCNVSISIGNVGNDKKTSIITHYPVEFQEF